MGRTTGTGPAASAGPSRGSGVGVVLHELHVGIHHLPHQLLQGGREADEGPSAGDERTGSTSGAAWSTTSPPRPPAAGQGGDGALLGSFRHGPGRSPGACVGAVLCTGGARRCHGGCCLQSKNPGRVTENGISLCARVTPHRGSPLPSPPCRVQSTPEGPLTSNVTLGFQFSFCLALVQSPCRKSCGKEERGAVRSVHRPHLDGLSVARASLRAERGRGHRRTLPRTKYFSLRCNFSGSSYAYKSPGGSILSPGYFRPKELFFVFVCARGLNSSLTAV